MKKKMLQDKINTSDMQKHPIYSMYRFLILSIVVMMMVMSIMHTCKATAREGYTIISSWQICLMINRLFILNDHKLSGF